MKDGKIKALTNERELLDMRKLTTEEIKERIFDLVGSEYKLLSEYVNSKTKFRIKHVACGCEYKVSWNAFQKGNRCPKCGGTMKLTTKDIKERIYSVEGDNYELLSEYVNSQTKIKIKHVACGHQYEILWGDFQQGVRCPKCAGKYRYKDNEISELISEMTNGEYTKQSEYINAHTKFRIKHNTCGHEYEVKWNTFQQGSRCPKCAILAQKNKVAFTNEDIVKAMYKLVGDEYTKLDDTYINSNTKFSIRHNVCGCIYEVRWNDFRSGVRCPKCNQSKGEKFIEDYLTNQGISFATQVRFVDCRYKNPLPFDFGILNSDGEVVALLEFDGEQHFQPIEAWGGEEKLKITQIRDAIKNQYCQDNDLPLLRIKYDENIGEKLSLFLYKLKGPKSQREMEEAPTT